MVKQTIRLFEMGFSRPQPGSLLGLFSPRCRDTASPGGSHAVIGYDTSVTETGSEYHGTSVGLGHRSVGALILPQALCLQCERCTRVRLRRDSKPRGRSCFQPCDVTQFPLAAEECV